VDYAMGRNKMGAYQIKAVVIFFSKEVQGVNFHLNLQTLNKIPQLD